MQINHHNPPTLHRNPAFTQVVTVKGPSTLVFVGGQNAVDAMGNIVGDDLSAQTEQALRNVIAALKAINATSDNVVRLAVYVVHGQDIRNAFAAAQRVWGARATAMTVLIVAALANPRFLVEIEATATVEP
jgi:enamine deaminase RidA (YjgF/YER057c/UK114 family)